MHYEVMKQQDNFLIDSLPLKYLNLPCISEVGFIFYVI